METSNKQQSSAQPSGFQRLLNRARDLLFYRGFVWLWRRRLNGKAMIYLYHRIESQGTHPFLDSGGSPCTDAQEFRRDIRYLKELGAEFVRFSDLAGCDFSSNSFYVVICADDGFSSNYQTGIQVADSEAIPMTIFQCAAMLSGSALIWEHQLYHLYFSPQSAAQFKDFVKQSTAWPLGCDTIRDTIPAAEIEKVVAAFLLRHPEIAGTLDSISDSLYPTVDQLQSAQAKGHEIASHGNRHFKRSLITDEEFHNELQVSKSKLGKLLGQPVSAFSYPFNSYLAGDDVRCAKMYTMVATVDGGWVDKNTRLLQIPRNTFPGHARSVLRHRRWLLTGSI